MPCACERAFSTAPAHGVGMACAPCCCWLKAASNTSSSVSQYPSGTNPPSGRVIDSCRAMPSRGSVRKAAAGFNSSLSCILRQTSPTSCNK